MAHDNGRKLTRRVNNEPLARVAAMIKCAVLLAVIAGISLIGLSVPSEPTTEIAQAVSATPKSTAARLPNEASMQ
jgi:hypothetical protein